jgi:ABC-type multidrug transport system fused ATPase/permease subunit
VSDGVPFLVSAVVSLVAAFVGLAIVSPMIALLSLLVVPPMLGSARWLMARSREVYPRARRINGEMVAEMAETFEGAAEIRAFGRRDDRRTRFAGDNRRAAMASLDGMRMRLRFFSAVTLIQSVVTAMVVVVAATFALDGRLSAGVVAAAVIGVTRVFEPLAEIVEYADEIQSARAALDRVAAVIELDVPSDRLPTLGDAPGSAAVGPVASDIVFDSVSFGYFAEHRVIHDVSLRFEAGSTTAIVGDTGAGKSTLARLITGLAAPSTGTVKVAGFDIAALAPRERRRLVVTVLQEGFCVEGTLADNVRLADPTATNAEVIASLEHSGGGWWRDLPAGIDSAVGPGGKGLSSGQRQLLALARVVLLDPKVVVLDEATSLLDPTTEADVAEALARTFAGRAVVIIAHRRATAKRCARVVRIVDGRVIADGPPDTVLDFTDGDRSVDPLLRYS